MVHYQYSALEEELLEVRRTLAKARAIYGDDKVKSVYLSEDSLVWAWGIGAIDGAEVRSLDKLEEEEAIEDFPCPSCGAESLEGCPFS